TALVQALRHQLRSRPDDLQLIQALVQTYERVGEPQPALDYLLQHAKTPATLEILAQLAERAGQPYIALQSWRRLLKEPGQATPARAMRAAVLALTHGRPDEGLAWLEAAQQQPPTPETATDFWRLTGQLAESRQRAPLAITAYRKLLATKDTDVGDFDGLIRMLLLDYPLEAAQVAAHAWERYHQPRHLLQALALYSNRSQWGAFATLLKPLESDSQTSRETLSILWKSPEFLRLAGTWHQNQGRMAEARRLYEAGLRASPNSTDMQQALLWLFIDGNDTVSLRALLATHEQDWRRSEDVHDALAAAYQALSLPQTALDRYLTPHFKAQQNNFLWLMNYADALDQNQQSDRAWRLRRLLLSNEWQAARAGESGTRLTHAQARQLWLTDAGLDQTRRIARTRLMLTQRPGDAATDVLRELLRLDRDARGNFSNAAAETAIGWLQDAGEYTAERGFLWHQYARSHSLRANRPLWAEITVALAENDRAASGQLLETFDERLPRYDRIHAAAVAQDVRLAQSAAFETQNDQYDDAPLHLQLTENLLAFSDHAGTRLSFAQLGGMDEQRADAVLHFAMSPRLSLDLNIGHINRQANDPTVIRNVPNEELREARLHWKHLDGETMVYAASRNGFASTTPFQLTHEQRLDNRLTLQVDIGMSLPSEESLALRLAGMKSRAGLSLRYQATRQDQFSLTHAAEHYQLQTGAEVGSGRHSTLQYTHTYRQDAPSLEWSAFWSTHAYRRRDLTGREPASFGVQGFLPPDTTELGPDYFLPDNFRFYGIELSTNTRYAQDYTRALRPFASISRTWHSRLGPGYGVRLGMAGSVWGVDHLSLSWGQSKSGIQAQGTTRDLQLTYRLHF
ncbi:MAG: tetratricopeptide repeat protein, partial [Giesbergeria sp.]